MNNNIEERLNELCLSQDQTSFDNVFVAGAWMEEVDVSLRKAIDAKYGFVKYCTEKEKPLIRLGFDYVRQKNLIIISHNPQTLPADTLCCRVSRSYYYVPGFRVAFLKDFLDTMREIGVCRVVSVSAENCGKVKYGSFSQKVASKIINETYESMGFLRDSDNNYCFNLR